MGEGLCHLQRFNGSTTHGIMKTSDENCAGNCVERVTELIRFRGKRSIRTLGGRSEVTLGRDSRGMYCVTSGGNKLRISEEMIRLVCDRYWSLKQSGEINSRGTPCHLATGKYNTDEWVECPHIRTSPYLAAVIALLNREHPFVVS